MLEIGSYPVLLRVRDWNETQVSSSIQTRSKVRAKRAAPTLAVRPQGKKKCTEEDKAVHAEEQDLSARNPYAREMYEHSLDIEKSTHIDHRFLTVQKEVTEAMRTILADWYF